MSTGAGLVADESCRALSRIAAPLDPERVHRFVVGVDRGPVALDAGEAARLLGDPFATLLLLRGTFPRSGLELVTQLRRASGALAALSSVLTFVLGEGSQIPFGPDTARLERGLRFLAACGETGTPDVIVSTPGPHDPFVEVMAWDRAIGGFNLYRTVRGAWVYAGNSRDALRPASAGKGPFETHVTGNLIMKELTKPWMNWHSPDAEIAATAFAPDDDRRLHPWFTGATGADEFEQSVTRPAIRRWTKARFAARAEPAARVLEQLLVTRTVNLASSSIESRRAIETGSTIQLPVSFFADVDALCDVLELARPAGLALSAAHYAQTLETFDVALRAPGFEQPGDTHFAFLVPERAFEDQAALEAALGGGLLTPRLAATLLMVDFPNPVFSARRARLLAHAPDVPDDRFAEATGAAILAAAATAPEASPEREFAELWAAGEDWRSQFDARLRAYYRAVAARLATQAGADDYARLAESRRDRVRALPLFENALLFATTNLPRAQLEMRADGGVRAVARAAS